ncbi:MAG: hypothetical protein GY803_12985, partial [Chloroflexi bacterium]|nr:hypothetical protein [Chloroflexota bacterium]
AALSGPNSGDILLLSNYHEGYYFAFPYKGIHGGLHPDDSRSVMAYGLSAGPQEVQQVRMTLKDAIEARCRTENNRHVNIADVVYGVKAVMGWME